MLSGYARKIKGWIRENEGDIFTALIIVLTAISAFGLGRLSAIYDAKAPLVIKNAAEAPASSTTVSVRSSVNTKPPATTGAGKYLASKNGQKYYPADCPAASRVSEQNRIWFNSAVEAEQAGLSLSSACK
jgi:hypothetical protein